jgi:hypothetical protein
MSIYYPNSLQLFRTRFSLTIPLFFSTLLFEVHSCCCHYWCEPCTLAQEKVKRKRNDPSSISASWNLLSLLKRAIDAWKKVSIFDIFTSKFLISSYSHPPPSILLRKRCLQKYLLHPVLFDRIFLTGRRRKPAMTALWKFGTDLCCCFESNQL